MRNQAIAGLVILAAMLYGAAHFTVDDAYIYQRYAENLAAGHGLCFNAGQRSEGYASPLWLVALTALRAVGLDGILAGKLLGCACLAGGLWLLYAAGGYGLLATALLFPYLGLHALAGLETCAAFAACAWIVYALARHHSARLALACTVLALFRPEGAAVGLAIGGVQCWRSWRAARAPFDPNRGIVLGLTEYWWAAAFAVPVLGYWIWRAFYFHELLPLPVTAKLHGAPAMTYQLRYLAPYVPLIAREVWALAQLLVPHVRRTAMTLALCLTGLAMLVAADDARDYMRLTAAHRYLGDTLARAEWPGEKPWIAVSDAGAIPYMSGLPAVDMLGLTDPHTARGGDNARYVLAHRPAVIVALSSSADVYLPLLAAEIPVVDSARAAGYMASATLEGREGSYYLWALWNPETPDGRAFEAAVIDAQQRMEEAVVGPD